MNIKSLIVVLIICFVCFTNAFADENSFLFNPIKLKSKDFILSINVGLPLPSLGFRTSFPLGNVDGHLFYYYYLGSIQVIRPEIDLLYSERYKLTADFVISDAPFLNTDNSTIQSLNLMAGGIVAQISSPSIDSCFSGLIGYYKANTAIPNTNVNNLIYIGLVFENKEEEKRGIYHKIGAYMPIGSGQGLFYPSYTFGYVFY